MFKSSGKHSELLEALTSLFPVSSGLRQLVGECLVAANRLITIKLTLDNVNVRLFRYRRLTVTTYRIHYLNDYVLL